MVVGVMRLVLRIPENRSLKGKRKVLRQVIDRTRARFQLAIAETAHQNDHQLAELGLACVSGDARVCNSVLDRAGDFIESVGAALVTSREMEIIHL